MGGARWLSGRGAVAEWVGRCGRVGGAQWVGLVGRGD